MNKTYTPYLWQNMQALHQRHPLSGHTPGHKNGIFLPDALQTAWGHQFASYDFTELDGLDNLHFSSGCIRQSQTQAAEIFGAGQCFYLVNGTTAGLQAAIMASCSNKQVFVPRHVHRSVYHSLLLAHAQPIYLPLELDEATSLPLGISTDVLAQYISQYPDCKNLILVNPTYQGITANNVQCVQLAKEHNITVIVDEAHGSHLHFHEKLPSSLLDAGADLVVQSWHKTLPVLTQGSALLVHRHYKEPSPEAFLSLLQTTSPSYLLLASLEAGSIYMGTDSHKHISDSLQTIYDLHSRIENNLQTLHLLWKPEWNQDPFKLYLTSDFLNGAEMDAYLREQHAIYSEMQDSSGILFILPIQTDEAWTDRLYNALLALDQYASKKIGTKKEDSTDTDATETDKTSRSISQSFYCRTIPQQIYPLQDAFYREKEAIPWHSAANHTAGQFILRYPPGIPLLVPGERITQEIVDLWQACGGDGDELVTVIKE